MTQRCKHVDAIRAELREAGATGIAIVRRGGHVRISWTLGGRASSILTAAHPVDDVVARNTSRQALHRALREVRAS